MNKQEAIEIVESRAFNIGDIDLACGLSYTKHIINQIDEPQKVTIPKFVAEWIVETEKIHNNLSWVWFSNPVSDKLNDWLKNHTETFMRAWLDGYTVEKEKLYTVEIAEAILTKIKRGRNVQYKMLPSRDVSDVFNNGIYYITRLTEKEIKEADERLWEFAKEVEEK